MDTQAAPSQKHILKARIQEFIIPPVRDSLVLGKDSPHWVCRDPEGARAVRRQPFHAHRDRG